MGSRCESLIGIILQADLYGTKPQLKMNRMDSFRTGFGSFLTISSIIVMAATFIYFGLQLLDVSNPKIVMSITNMFDPPLLKLSNENYGIAFGLQDPITYNQFIDEGIYRVEIYQKKAERVEIGNSSEFNWTVTQLPIEICDKSKFPTSYQDLISTMPLNNIYCLKDTSFEIFGTFLNPSYSFLYVKIFECRNNTNTPRVFVNLNQK